MTRHLTPEELIDSRERQLSPARQAHADACHVCRAELARLDEVLLDVAAVDVPEPSPLFWDHLSARIRERVAQEPTPAAVRDNPFAPLIDWLTGWSAAPRWAFAAATLALCASLGWFAWSELRHDAQGPSTGTARGAAASTSASTSPAPASTPAKNVAEAALAATSEAGADVDDEWTLIVRMAEEVSWDEAEGSSMYVRPAAVDRALIELTVEERSRLLQLMQADLARHKSS